MSPTPPACAREPLVDAITTFLAHKRGSDIPEIRSALERAIDEAGPDAIASLGRRLGGACSEWGYYPGDPLARRIHHALAPAVLKEQPIVTGVEHLRGVTDKQLVLVANHLSYSDANLVEVLLRRVGASTLADRLTVVAGPKVYSNVTRRFSSLCFGTIKVPQSPTRSSEDAVMNARDVARAARRAIDVAQERLQLGEALLIFPEGSRSRSGEMQRLLSAVARYVESPGTWVLPLGIEGTERLFPVGGDSLTATRVALHIGRPLPPHELQARAAGDRRRVVDALGFAIAELLPRRYRGVYLS
jgi:1-acyl-sn-glycerol-3-phosphate acyltransferase